MICLGCGNFGGIGSAPAFFGRGTGEEEARAIMDAAWAAGIRWFDTADAYGGGASESFIGRWRADRAPVGLAVTTKVFNPLYEGDAHGLSRDRIRRNVEGSLERLGVERIDYYLAHDRDLETPLAETVARLRGAGRRGDDRCLGPVEPRRRLAIREALGHGRPALVQNGYSLLNRRDAADVLPLCAEHGIDYVPFGPLEGGWLAGEVPPGRRAIRRARG